MVVGIDLGTTYSAGAYLDKQGVPHIIDNSEGNSLTPSVVLFDTDDNIVVGDVAKDNAFMRPQDVVAVVKNYMGKKTVLKEQGGVKYTPEMISSFIIRKVVQDASAALGEAVTEAVITVPAYFTDAQRVATENAATIAGVHLVGMVNEPTAAALCYIHQHDVKNENILIYDLGGGTFDVTILHVVDKSHIEVVATGGLSSAGGRMFDQFIVDHVREIMDEKHDIDLEDDEYVDELQELYLKAENAKMQLSSKASVTIPLKIGKVKEQIVIQREDFESMIRPTYESTERKIKETLRAANLQAGSIDKILLVGGSSRIPYVEQRIEQFFGKAPLKTVNPDEAVAIGAALYANIRMQENHSQKLVDVCSHSIGVAVYNDKGQQENEVIIPRNSKLPIVNQQRFRTMADNQSKLELIVTEGEYKELTDVTTIGNFEIGLPGGLPANSLILIKISLDIHQLIHIHIALPDVGFEQEYHMKRTANMDEEAVQNVTGMLRDHKVS